MDKDQIKKISLAFDLSEDSIKKCLKDCSLKRLPKKISLFSSKENIETLNKPVKTKEYFYFLESDFNLLVKQIEEVALEIKRIGSEIGDSVSDSNTFHDNFEYEELGRQQKMWTNRLKSLKEFKENVKITEANTFTDSIGIGNKVTMEAASGEILIKKIGSYITFSNHSLSYNSPLAKLLIGKKIGDEIIITIENKTKSFRIKDVH